MAPPPTIDELDVTRDQKIICRSCGEGKHPSRFYKRKRKRKGAPNGTVWDYDPDCKKCQQTARVEEKYADLAAWTIKQRAKERASRIGCSTAFLLDELDWNGLIPELRAMIEHGKCRSCRHPFTDPSDVEIDHIEAPRWQGDWAREDHRNLVLMCASCNNSKKRKVYAKWLDEEDEARQSINKQWLDTHDEKTGEETLFPWPTEHG